MSNDLDLRGVVCPLTTVKLTRHLRKVPAGTSFLVFADDDEARVDFPALIATTKNEYIGIEEKDGYQIYSFRKK